MRSTTDTIHPTILTQSDTGRITQNVLYFDVDFVASLDTFKKQNVVVFKHVDFFIVWFMLMIQNYKFLGERLVTFDDKTVDERVDWIKARLKRLSPADIKVSFSKGK
jgi:hypothetical protein